MEHIVRIVKQIMADKSFLTRRDLSTFIGLKANDLYHIDRSTKMAKLAEGRLREKFPEYFAEDVKFEVREPKASYDSGPYQIRQGIVRLAHLSKELNDNMMSYSKFDLLEKLSATRAITDELLKMISI
jgi:hypothetical protein